MLLETKKHLEDIRVACDRILRFVDKKSLEEYKIEEIVRFAVERQFMIIGEAVRRLASTDPSTVLHIDHFQRIISFRNMIVHGYDIVDDETVWSIIRNRLPRLLDEVIELLAESESPERQE